MGRFATMIFSVTQRCSINILLLLFFFINNVASIQNNVATLYCAKNRRCESSRVTSTLR